MKYFISLLFLDEIENKKEEINLMKQDIENILSVLKLESKNYMKKNIANKKS